MSTVKELKEAIKDLPDDMEVRAESDYEVFIVDDVETRKDYNYILLHLA